MAAGKGEGARHHAVAYATRQLFGDPAEGHISSAAAPCLSARAALTIFLKSPTFLQTRDVELRFRSRGGAACWFDTEELIRPLHYNNTIDASRPNGRKAKGN